MPLSQQLESRLGSFDSIHFSFFFMDTHTLRVGDRCLTTELTARAKALGCS